LLRLPVRPSLPAVVGVPVGLLVVAVVAVVGVPVVGVLVAVVGAVP